MLVFVLVGLVVLTVVGAVGVLVIRRLATDQAIDEARQVTAVLGAGRGARVTDGIVTGDAGARGDVASVVVDAVLHDPDRPREDLDARRHDRVLRRGQG